MPPGSADYKVEIVDASGAPDMSVAVVGDQVVDLSGATDGQVLTVQPDGTVAPEAPAAPSGAAGGVLSGTYPNPGFAVDMATQAELDAKVTQTIANGVTTSAPSEDAVFDALAGKVATTGHDNDSVPVSLAGTIADLDMGASTILARLASGNIVAATVAQARAMLIEPLVPLASGNWATGDNYSAGQSKVATTQSLRLRYFTARSATPITSVATLCQVVGSVDASVARIGIWSLAANGVDLATLVASTDHDAALWRTTGKRTKALAAQWVPVVGQRYAVGILVVQASGTLPSLQCVTGLIGSAIPVEGTVANASLGAQSDLPSSATIALGADSGPYVEFIP